MSKYRRVYKMLDRDGLSPQMRFRFPLPVGGRFGEWVEAKGTVRVAVGGFHGYTDPRPRDGASRVFLMEIDGDIHEQAGIVAARRARLVREVRPEPLSRRPVKRGVLRCKRCHKVHNAYRWSKDLAPQWSSLDDGHSYAPESLEELVARLPAGLRRQVLAA